MLCHQGTANLDRGKGSSLCFFFTLAVLSMYLHLSYACNQNGFKCLNEKSFLICEQKSTGTILSEEIHDCPMGTFCDDLMYQPCTAISNFDKKGNNDECSDKHLSCYGKRTLIKCALNNSTDKYEKTKFSFQCPDNTICNADGDLPCMQTTLITNNFFAANMETKLSIRYSICGLFDIGCVPTQKNSFSAIKIYEHQPHSCIHPGIIEHEDSCKHFYSCSPNEFTDNKENSYIKILWQCKKGHYFSNIEQRCIKSGNEKCKKNKTSLQALQDKIVRGCTVYDIFFKKANKPYSKISHIRTPLCGKNYFGDRVCDDNDLKNCIAWNDIFLFNPYPHFSCNVQGIFRDVFNCKITYTCVPTTTISKYSFVVRVCPERTVYSVSKGTCVDEELGDCYFSIENLPFVVEKTTKSTTFDNSLQSTATTAYTIHSTYTDGDYTTYTQKNASYVTSTTQSVTGMTTKNKNYTTKGKTTTVDDHMTNSSTKSANTLDDNSVTFNSTFFTSVNNNTTKKEIYETTKTTLEGSRNISISEKTSTIEASKASSSSIDNITLSSIKFSEDSKTEALPLENTSFKNNTTLTQPTNTDKKTTVPNNYTYSTYSTTDSGMLNVTESFDGALNYTWIDNTSNSTNADTDENDVTSKNTLDVSETSMNLTIIDEQTTKTTFIYNTTESSTLTPTTVKIDISTNQNVTAITNQENTTNNDVETTVRKPADVETQNVTTVSTSIAISTVVTDIEFTNSANITQTIPKHGTTELPQDLKTPLKKTSTNSTPLNLSSISTEVSTEKTSLESLNMTSNDFVYSTTESSPWNFTSSLSNTTTTESSPWNFTSSLSNTTTDSKTKTTISQTKGKDITKPSTDNTELTDITKVQPSSSRTLIPTFTPETTLKPWTFDDNIPSITNVPRNLTSNTIQIKTGNLNSTSGIENLFSLVYLDNHRFCNQTNASNCINYIQNTSEILYKTDVMAKKVSFYAQNNSALPFASFIFIVDDENIFKCEAQDWQCLFSDQFKYSVKNIEDSVTIEFINSFVSMGKIEIHLDNDVKKVCDSDNIVQCILKVPNVTNYLYVQSIPTTIYDLEIRHPVFKSPKHYRFFFESNNFICNKENKLSCISNYLSSSKSTVISNITVHNYVFQKIFSSVNESNVFNSSTSTESSIFKVTGFDFDLEHSEEINDDSDSDGSFFYTTVNPNDIIHSMSDYYGNLDCDSEEILKLMERAHSKVTAAKFDQEYKVPPVLTPDGFIVMEDNVGCVKGGSFGDINDCEVFHICAGQGKKQNQFKSSNNFDYILFHCTPGTFFSAVKRTCIETDVECPSKYFDNVPDYLYKFKNIKTHGYPKLADLNECKSPGIYAINNSCNRYYMCFYADEDTLVVFYERCPIGTQYHRKKQMCTSVSVEECAEAFFDADQAVTLNSIIDDYMSSEIMIKETFSV